jgi:hypothetical protein
MPDQIRASEQVGLDLPGDQTFAWSPTVVENDTDGEAAAAAPERDERDESDEGDEVVDGGPELDIAAQELTETSGQAPGASSDRAVELESEHWRERAIVWRERAMGAELVAKMLQRNLDDLRANLDDLRLKVEAAAAADAKRAAAIAVAETPWRRFARDMYDKYLG